MSIFSFFEKKVIKSVKVFVILLSVFSVKLLAKPFIKDHDLDQTVQQVLLDYDHNYKSKEYFSGIAVSIYIPHDKIRSYYVGYVSHDPHSQPINATTLFQIGSITKSLTAALVLKLTQDNLLNLENTIGQWLPEYKKWSDINIRHLLNMTSGIPNYSEAPLWSAAIYQHPEHIWSKKELIDFTYPSNRFSPPLKKEYFYSNTNYILTALIIEKATQKPFSKLLIQKIITPSKLLNTFYSETTLPPNIKNRLAQGYGYNQYDDIFLLGKKINHVNLSWAGAAGGAVSNSSDIIKWVQTLFVSKELLNNLQKSEMTKLVSTDDGKPIQKITTPQEKGFSLGLAQAYDISLGGQYWYYEGETLGFRALYFYQPNNGVIISCILNSATNTENDHAGILIKKIYQILKNQV